MLNKGLWMGLALALLVGCDAQTPPTAPAPAPETVHSAPSIDRKQLAERYAGRTLEVIDVSEIQLDGASALSVTFSIPLEPEQRFAERLHLVDSKDGSVDGAWELSDDLTELRLRHLPPQRKLVLTIDAGLKAVNQAELASEYTARLTTRDVQPSVGFASRGSVLPTRLAEGLPVIALNVDQVNVEFFRIKREALPAFVSRWRQSGSLELWSSEELLPMADLVYGGRFDLNPPRNTRETVLLPISGIEALKQPGMYLAVMRQAGRYTYTLPATLFSLSDIGVSARRYHSQLDVFTQALEGGKALGQVNLELLDDKGALLAEARTDGAGHAQLPLADKARVLLAHQGEHTTVLNLGTAALDLSEFAIEGPASHALQFFVFGPRNLYRPGETVLLNGLLRDQDGRAVKAQPVSVQVRRPDEQISRSFVWSGDEGGLYQYTLALAEDAPTGRWQLLMDLGDGRQQVYEFLVEDFLPERLALELTTSNQPLAASAAPRFTVEGRYLYGAPAAGNRLSGQLYVRPLREALESLPGYQFGDITEADLTQDQELDEQLLDDKGRAELRPENRWAETKSPLRLIVQASLQESGGRPITRRAIQPVWPAERLVGIRPLFSGEEVDADSLAEFDVLLVDQAGRKLAADDLQVRLVRERRDYFWNYSDDQGWQHNYTEKFLTLSRDTLRLEQGATAKLSFPVEWGPYRVEVQDPATGLVSSVRFWAGYRWQDNAEGGSVRPDQVKLALDKPGYKAGDVAKVRITPPAPGQGYLLLESSDGPLWWQAIEVGEQGLEVDLPIDAAWARHDLYLSALVIRPGERKAQVTPKRAVGILHLPLAREARKLAVGIQAPEKVRPNKPLPVTVSVTHADGTPAAGARVLVAAVDSGILNITEFATPDPFAAFFGRKGYSVDQLDMYGQLIEGQGRLATLAYGGDAGLSAGGKRPDTSVLIVAEQGPVLTLDDQGQAELSLPIPDFNGELRLMVQAFGEDTFGHAEQKTQVAAPLIAELSLPRFLAGGDEAQLALELNNLSGAAQSLELELTSNGHVQLVDVPARALRLDKDQRLTLPLTVRAEGGLGQGQLNLRVNGLQLPEEGAGELSRQWQVGVRPAYPAQLKHFRVVLEGQAWQLPAGTLEAFEPAGLEARLAVSSRPPLNLAEQLRALKAYPYGCAEQTTSGLYPALYADAATRKRLGLEAEDQLEQRRRIELGVERLLGMQRHNGSFGLWSAESEEDYWLSVYVTDFLLRAQQQGYAVPAPALKNASERLLRYLQQSSLIAAEYSDDPAHTRFAVQAYAAEVLARSQQAPLGNLRSLFERRGEARAGLPLVQLAAALKLMGDTERAQQALSEGLTRERGARQWLGDYGSSLRDQALIIALMEEHQLAPGQAESRLFELADTLAGQDWLSTQERNALFMAGRSLLAQPEQAWRALLHSGRFEFVLSDQQSALSLDRSELAEPLSVQAQADAPLYQQLTLSGYPRQAPTPSGDVLQIERQYLSLDGQLLDRSTVQSGDLLLVHLAVRAKERVPDALVVDLLPAGLELENQNLASSAARLGEAAAALKPWLEDMQQGRIQHQEYRADRYVAALELPAQQPRHLLYLARAVTPGQYQVPPPQVESMYRPAWQAVGEAGAALKVQGR